MSLMSPAMLQRSRQSVRTGLRSVTWGDVFSAENALPNLLRLLAGTLILVLAHLFGSWLSATIKRSSLDDGVDEGDVYLTEGDTRAVRAVRSSRDAEGTGAAGGAARFAASKTASLAAGAAYVLVIVLASTAILALFGVHIAGIIAGLTTLLIVVGLSLQGTMSDIASGVLLALFQTYDVGDVIVVDDVEGTVLDFRLVNTVLEDLETRALVTIPNSMIQSKTVHNLSRHRFHYFAFEVVFANTLFLADGSRLRFDDVCRSLEASLTPQAFPGVLREAETGAVARADVAGMHGAGTRVVVRVPMLTNADLYVQRRRVMTAVRDTLGRMGAQLWDSDYSFLDKERDRFSGPEPPRRPTSRTQRNETAKKNGPPTS